MDHFETKKNNWKKRIESPIGMLTTKQQTRAKQADKTTTNTFYCPDFFKNTPLTETTMNPTFHWQNRLFMHYKF